MTTSGDAIVARLAVERGFVTPDQLTRAVIAQTESDGASLYDVLVEKKLLNPDAAQELRHAVEVASGRARLIAGYEVIAKLGQGGMGAVYKARKLDDDQVVALKLLPPSLADERTVARFKREFYAASHLRHPNIVSSVEFGYDEGKGVYYCALEYVDGENLGDRILRVGKIPEKEAIDIARQVALALEQARLKELIHRDVKPGNIMITPDGTAKILDLGLARSATSEVTRVTLPGAFVGTPHYVSPEQAVGREDLDIRGDIYSLGATMYHMLTGTPPFDGNNSMVILQKHVTEMLPWPGDVVPELSDDVCVAIAKMMAKDPSDRYQTPRELADDMDMLLRGESPKIETSEISRSSIERAAKALRSRGRRRRPPTQKRKRASTREQRFKPPSSSRPRPPSSTRIRPAARARASAARQQLAEAQPPEAPPPEADAVPETGVWHDLVESSSEHLSNLASATRRFWLSLQPRTRLKVLAAGLVSMALAVIVLVVVILMPVRSAPDADAPAPRPVVQTAAEALTAVQDIARKNANDHKAAIAGYEALVLRFPDSPEARIARSRIAALRLQLRSGTTAPPPDDRSR